MVTDSKVVPIGRRGDRFTESQPAVLLLGEGESHRSRLTSHASFPSTVMLLKLLQISEAAFDIFAVLFWALFFGLLGSATVVAIGVLVYEMTLAHQ